MSSKIDPYKFELYRFKVGGFLDTVYIRNSFQRLEFLGIIIPSRRVTCVTIKPILLCCMCETRDVRSLAGAVAVSSVLLIAMMVCGVAHEICS